MNSLSLFHSKDWRKAMRYFAKFAYIMSDKMTKLLLASSNFCAIMNFLAFSDKTNVAFSFSKSALFPGVTSI